MSADTCGTAACGTCVLGGAATADGGIDCCGGRGAAVVSTEDRTVLTASGAAIAVVAMVLVITGTGAVALLAGVPLVGGLGLALAGGSALRRGGAVGDRLITVGTRFLPAATGALLVALAVRVGTALLT